MAGGARGGGGPAQPRSLGNTPGQVGAGPGRALGAGPGETHKSPQPRSPEMLALYSEQKGACGSRTCSRGSLGTEEGEQPGQVAQLAGFRRRSGRGVPGFLDAVRAPGGGAGAGTRAGCLGVAGMLTVAGQWGSSSLASACAVARSTPLTRVSAPLREAARGPGRRLASLPSTCAASSPSRRGART